MRLISRIEINFLFFHSCLFRSQLFHVGGPHHIENSPLIWRAKQWTGFCMIETPAMKRLRQELNLWSFFVFFCFHYYNYLGLFVPLVLQICLTLFPTFHFWFKGTMYRICSSHTAALGFLSQLLTASKWGL